MNDENGDKYLDPAQNPMILVPEKETEPLKVGDFGFDAEGQGRAPFVDWDVTPENLSEKLAAAFPGENEIKVGSRILVRMTDGSYTEKASGKPINELPLADMMMLADFLKDKEKR